MCMSNVYMCVFMRKVVFSEYIHVYGILAAEVVFFEGCVWCGRNFPCLLRSHDTSILVWRSNCVFTRARSPSLSLALSLSLFLSLSLSISLPLSLSRALALSLCLSFSLSPHPIPAPRSLSLARAFSPSFSLNMWLHEREGAL